MSDSITFDRFRLSIPVDSVTICKPTEFTTTVSGEGVPIRSRYEQSAPFFYSLTIDHAKSTSEFEFSGKALLDDYPALISHANISTCFENINRCGVCLIDSDRVLEYGFVKQCDVTRDITSPFEIRELYNNVTFSSNKRWCVRDNTSNRFSIESTNITKRFKSRMIVYDKGTEMSRVSHREFYSAVGNAEYQRDYFRGKTRLELNLNSKNRIQHYFNTDDTGLSNILNSDADPIARFLEEALADNDTLYMVSKYIGRMKDLEHLMLLAYCGYNVNMVEQLIRGLCGKTCSISRTKKPFISLMAKLKNIIPEPLADTDCISITSHLKSMLARLQEPEDNLTPDLLKLYSRSKRNITPAEKCNLCNNCASISDIGYPTLPNL